MKNDVIKFLAETPKSKPEQFNQALSLYRRSKNHDQSQARFMNNLGYSEARLEILLYELKKLYGVTDLQVASARSVFSKEVKDLEVKDAEEVEGNTDSTNMEGDDSANTEAPATSDASQETGDAPAEPPAKTKEDTSEATSDNSEATSSEEKKEAGFQQVENKDLLAEKLSDFDVEKEDYNSIKSFAADVSDFTGEDPADQKKVTLIAFIQEAKKKLLAN